MSSISFSVYENSRVYTPRSVVMFLQCSSIGFSSFDFSTRFREKSTSDYFAHFGGYYLKWKGVGEDKGERVVLSG